jgi:hypothetical protein
MAMVITTYHHPDDHATMCRVGEIARQAAHVFGLPLRTVEHKRRPHPGGTTGLCYPDEGRISILVRYREGKLWWSKPLVMREILHTTAHELAHLRHADHGPAFKNLEALIWSYISNTFAEAQTERTEK